MGEVRKGKLFDLPRLWHTLFDPNVGVTFVISLIFFLAFSCAIIYGFQPFTLNILKISPSQNAVLFTLFGIVGLISQTFIVGRFSKLLGIKKSFTTSIFFTSLSFLIMFFSRSLLVLLWFSNSPVFNSMTQTLLPQFFLRSGC